MKLKAISFFLLSIMLFSGTALAGLSKTEISQLYVAIFNRASEGEGNRYWQTLELDMATTADIMLGTDAAKNYFGNSLNTDLAFIEHIYLNTLNKTLAEDYSGITYWVGLLEAGSSRGSVVASLVSVIKDYAPGGPYYNPSDIATITAYNQFINRTIVSDYMADTVENPPANWETATNFDSSGLNVTRDYETVTAAMDIIDGKKPILSLVPKSHNVGIDSGTNNFSIFNIGTGSMAWTAEVTSGKDWLTISSGKSGLNVGIVSYQYTANIKTISRTGKIRITAPGATESPQYFTVKQNPKIFDSYESMFTLSPRSGGVYIQGYWQAGSYFSFSITNNSDLVFKLSKAELKNGNDIIGSSSNKSLLSDGSLEPSESVSLQFTINMDLPDKGFVFIYYLEDISTGEIFEIQHEYVLW